MSKGKVIFDKFIGPGVAGTGLPENDCHASFDYAQPDFSRPFDMKCLMEK